MNADIEETDIEDEVEYYFQHEDEFWEAVNTEYWKKIDGWDYLISSEGRVYSNRTKTFLKPAPNNCGYYRVCLCENNLRSDPTVHTLVGKAFIPNPNNYSDVNHRNPEKKDDNSVRNLMWLPHRDNCRGDNKKRGHIGSVEPFGDGYWRARFKHNYTEYSRTRKNKEVVDTWLKNREYELINNLPLTDIEPEYNPKGSVIVCKNSWRVRVTLEDGNRWSKSVKTEEIGKQLKDYIIENVKNNNIKNKDDADRYYKNMIN
tara:strand:+ start:980 stop:1756 length:777 start_codon:yes stop_codon:yes gene_type:complete